MKKKNKSGKKEFKKTYSEAWKYIQESRNYIWFAFGIFILFGILGYLFPIYFVEEIEQFIKELITKTENFNTLQLISYIFLNNSWSAFIAILFGFIFGFVPLFSLIANGYLLGFVSSRVVAELGWFELWKLFPHGIFEIPAILIAIGLGLKLGTAMFHRKDIGKELRKRFILSLKVFFYVLLPLLILAAIIEGSLIGFFG